MKIKFIAISFILLLLFTGCSTGKESASVDDILAAFKVAGLEAENVTPMTKEDYGMAPMTAVEAKRFFIPSLGEDAGGRIFLFKSSGDLEKTKAYYDDLGKASAMFFSWTASKGEILIQVSGKLEEESFNKYKAVLDSIE